jgi:N-acetylmuramic acid 6-phosphate etherase
MTNVRSSNVKLKERSLRILIAETNLDETSAQNLMNEADGDLRTAIVMHKANVSRDEAENALQKNQNVIEQAIDFASSKS